MKGVTYMGSDGSLLTVVGISSIVGIIAFLAGFFLRKMLAEKEIKSAEQKAKDILESAKKEIEDKKREISIEGKDALLRIRTDFEKETRDRKAELLNLEKRLMQRETNLDRKVDLMDKKEIDVNKKEQDILAKEKILVEKKETLDKLIEEEKQKLVKISGLSIDEAKRILMTKLETEARHESAVSIKRIEDEARLQADKKAKEIVVSAIQKCAVDYTVESTVSVVNIPSEDMKGRIIGREGRNIRAFEVATGVDVIIDDTPEAVILSAFDVVRREIARMSLERLISDGRIHPGRIEEVVEKAKKEMEVAIREEGENSALEAGVHGLHPEIVRLLGRLKYRTSYGQNVLKHSKEVAYLMGALAGELKLDVKLAKRIGLLHDIGKAVTHEVEGSHALIGAELVKKYGEPADVIHGVEAHNEDVEIKTIYAALVNAADAISAARPGARRDTLESYVKRLEKLESIADSFAGVDKSFAIQAGREVRVIVKPESINDENALVLAKDITKKIEESMEYPGQIKVVVIRETRAIEYAK